MKNPETCGKILKIYAVISLVAGLLYVLLMIATLVLGALIAASTNDPEVLEFGVPGGYEVFAVAAVQLITAILCLRAVKDHTKIKPAWILILIALVLSVLEMILSFGNGIANTVTGILPVAFHVLGFAAANTIRKNNA